MAIHVADDTEGMRL